MPTFNFSTTGVFSLLLVTLINSSRKCLASKCYSHILEQYNPGLFKDDIITPELALALRSAVCPGDTINYVCTDEEADGVVSWSVWCLSDSSQTCNEGVPDSLDAITNFQSGTHHDCSTEGTATFAFTPYYITATQTSNLTITVPQESTKIVGITCDSLPEYCRYLKVAGIHSKLNFYLHSIQFNSCRCPLPSPELHTCP